MVWEVEVKSAYEPGGGPSGKCLSRILATRSICTTTGRDASTYLYTWVERRSMRVTKTQGFQSTLLEID